MIIQWNDFIMLYNDFRWNCICMASIQLSWNGIAITLQNFSRSLSARWYIGVASLSFVRVSLTIHDFLSKSNADFPWFKIVNFQLEWKNEEIWVKLLSIVNQHKESEIHRNGFMQRKYLWMITEITRVEWLYKKQHWSALVCGRSGC